MQKQVILALLLAAPATATITGVQFASGTLAVGAAAGNKSVTTVPFTPRGGLFMWNPQSAANQNTISSAASANLGFGLAVSSSNRAAGVMRRVATSTEVWSRQTNAAMMTTVDSAGAIQLAVDLVSFNANGFTVNVSISPSTDFLLQWWVWGGTELQANLVPISAPTATGSAATTGMGFRPDVLIIISMGMTGAIPLSDGNARPGIGFVDQDLNQAALGIRQINGANTSRRSQSTAHAVYIPDLSGMWVMGTVTSLDPDGFTISYTVVQTPAVKLWALGLAGLRATVGSTNQATVTGNQTITTGRTPSMVLMGSFCRAAASAQQNDGVISLGGATASAQGNNMFASTTGTNNIGQGNYNTQILTCLAAGTPTIDSQASFVGFTSTGLTINNGTVDATARQLIYLTMSPLPVNRLLISKRY